MTSRLLNWIEHRASGYLMWGTDREIEATPDSAEWFEWLGGLSSFHFQGEHGHFTARQEQKARGNQGYWYAYRKANKRQYRQYLGTTDKLTVAHLEDIASKVEEAVLSNPQPKRGKRKPVKETKEDLRKRLTEQEKVTLQKDKEIARLERELEQHQNEIITLNNKNLQLTNQLRHKRR